MATSRKPLVFTRPFEHLLCGTMELRLKNRKSYYFTPVMDGYSRYIMCLSLVKELNDDAVFGALRPIENDLVHPKFFEVTDKAYLHLTQRGAAKNQAFIDYVEKSPIFLMPEEGFKRNNYMTAFFSRFSTEFFNPYYSQFTSYKVLDDALWHFCEKYNDWRPQEALGGHTPLEFLQIGIDKLKAAKLQSQAKA